MESSRELYVCARMLWPLIAGLRYLGLPADDLMRQAGLPEAHTLEADRRLPLEAPLRFIELAIAHHGEGLGLQLARLYELGGFGLLDLIAQASVSPC